MNTSDSADELVKICIDGTDRILRIAGVGAKNIAMMLIAMSKEMKQTKGKTRLTNMLKTGKPLSIFTIKAEDLKKFSQEAKRYGVLYCALANKKNSKIDGMVDIMVRDEDASKLNRIAKRFNFQDVATIREKLDKDKEEKVNNADKLEKPKSENEQFIDDIMPKDKEEQKDIPSNNTKETEEKNQSEISSNTKLKDKTTVSNSNDNKKSVKKELKEIEKELKAKEEQKQDGQELQSDTVKTKDKEKGGKRYKEKDTKHKGKRYKEPKHLDTTPKSKKTKNKIKGRSK